MAATQYGNPVDWLLRDRRTGKIVIAQRPNRLILLSSTARGLRVVTRPSGGAADSALRAISTGALIVWAADETLRGVNPLRRMLGAVTLVVQGSSGVRQFRA
jgi:hypothetical protein